MKLGAKYISTPKPITKKEIQTSLYELKRATLIKHFPFVGEYEPPPKALKVKSNWIPSGKLLQGNLITINDMFDNLINNIDKFIHLPYSTYNWEDEITKELKNIGQRGDIKIVASDKNLGLIILNTRDYDKLITQHLSNKNIYEEIDCELTLKWHIPTKLQNIVEDWILSKHLTKHETKFVRSIQDYKYTAIFHGLPKLHKSTELAKLPIRPIVAKRPEQLQSRISIILTNRLLPYLQNFNTILNNSLDLKKELEKRKIKIPSLITIDFESLYTSIPLKNLYQSINNCTLFEKNFKDETIRMLKFIFENNYFNYGTKYFRQLDGIAMGTNVAPVIANLYLALTFDSITKREDLIDYLDLFKRYIDDCFIIYNEMPSHFINVIFPKLQQAAKPINLTYNIAFDSSIDFLDLTIAIDEECCLYTKIYQKPLNRYSYLPLMSHHPPATIKGFILGELTRYKRLCSRNEDFLDISYKFFDRLLSRGYTSRFLNPLFVKAFSQSFTMPKTSPPLPSPSNTRDIPVPTPTKDTLNMVIRYTPQTEIFKKINNNLKMIEKELYPDQSTTFRMAYKSNPNILNLTMKSTLTQNQITYLDSG